MLSKGDLKNLCRFRFEREEKRRRRRGEGGKEKKGGKKLFCFSYPMPCSNFELNENL